MDDPYAWTSRAAERAATRDTSHQTANAEPEDTTAIEGRSTNGAANWIALRTAVRSRNTSPFTAAPKRRCATPGRSSDAATTTTSSKKGEGRKPTILLIVPSRRSPTAERGGARPSPEATPPSRNVLERDNVNRRSGRMLVGRRGA